MNKEDFIEQIAFLSSKMAIGLKVDDLCDTNFSGEGILGQVIDAYGDLILSIVTGDSMIEIPDESYEDFWNCISSYPGEWTAEDIGNLYDELTEEE